MDQLKRYQAARALVRERNDAIIEAAVAAARTFVEEFPGQRVSGDWDAEAYAIDSANKNWPDEAWSLYRETLHARVDATTAKR